MRRDDRTREPSEFMESVVELSRVTRVQAGGKRMRFRALVVVGDKKGRIAFGLKKGQDVSMAVTKAATQGKKRLIHVEIINGTIPHQIKVKYKAAQVLLKPAKPGTGLIAGRTIRPVLELAGYTDIVAKMLGSSNKIANVAATVQALERL